MYTILIPIPPATQTIYIYISAEQLEFSNSFIHRFPRPKISEWMANIGAYIIYIDEKKEIY